VVVGEDGIGRGATECTEFVKECFGGGIGGESSGMVSVGVANVVWLEWDGGLVVEPI
jgi:hypothetical protein